jgi:AcrR family transcriptional regulator
MNRDSVIGKPVRLRERLREATAEAILDAAEQAFATEGARARMETIAGRAGIAVGTLYNHFTDREALWDALRRSRLDALLARLDAALDATRGRPFEEALRAMLAALQAHWAAHRGFLATLVQAEPALAQAAARPARERTVVQELVTRAARLVRRGVTQGVLRPDDADLYPVLLVGMMRAVMASDLSGDGGDALLDRVLTFFLRGAGRRP